MWDMRDRDSAVKSEKNNFIYIVSHKANQEKQIFNHGSENIFLPAVGLSAQTRCQD